MAALLFHPMGLEPCARGMVGYRRAIQFAFLGSCIDAGCRRQGSFVLFTGPGDDPWREAARHVSEDIGVEIKVVSIGPYLDLEDPYGRWREFAESREEGCIFVRPNLIVGWRCDSLPAEPDKVLGATMSRILGYEERSSSNKEASPSLYLRDRYPLTKMPAPDRAQYATSITP